MFVGHWLLVCGTLTPCLGDTSFHVCMTLTPCLWDFDSLFVGHWLLLYEKLSLFLWDIIFMFVADCPRVCGTLVYRVEHWLPVYVTLLSIYKGNSQKFIHNLSGIAQLSWPVVQARKLLKDLKLQKLQREAATIISAHWRGYQVGRKSRSKIPSIPLPVSYSWQHPCVLWIVRPLLLSNH